MKKLLYLLFVLLIVSCVKVEQTTNEPSFYEEISAFLETKASAPLEGTIWYHVTGDMFDKYLFFNNEKVNMFYGAYEESEGLERWSDFYSAPYTLNEGIVITDLTYPNYGKNEYNNKLDIIKSEGQFTISAGNEKYSYWGNDASTIDDQCILVTITISPWE